MGFICKDFFYLISKHPMLKILEEIVLHSWWVILLSILCYMWFEYESKKQEKTFLDLSNRLMELKYEKIHAQKELERLRKQINSQSDPAWVELTLIKGLGLVPEGHTKIYFSNTKK